MSTHTPVTMRGKLTCKIGELYIHIENSRWSDGVHEAFPPLCSTGPDLVSGCANGLDRTGAVEGDTAPGVPPNPAASNNAAFDAFDTVLECTAPSDTATESRYIDDTDRSE